MLTAILILAALSSLLQLAILAVVVKHYRSWARRPEIFVELAEDLAGRKPR